MSIDSLWPTFYTWQIHIHQLQSDENINKNTSILRPNESMGTATVQRRLLSSHDSKEFLFTLKTKWHNLHRWNSSRKRSSRAHFKQVRSFVRGSLLYGRFLQQFSQKIYCFLRQWADTRENKPVNHDHDCNSHIQFYWYDVFGKFFSSFFFSLSRLMMLLLPLCIAAHVKCNLSYFLFIKKWRCSRKIPFLQYNSIKHIFLQEDTYILYTRTHVSC